MPAILTPKGKLQFVFINGREGSYLMPSGKREPTGKYEATVELSQEQYEDFKKQLNDIWESTKEYQDIKDTVDVMNPNLGIKKRKDKAGNIHYQVKAKVKRMKKQQDGTEVERVITLKDGNLNELPPDTFIHSGSEGRLMIFVSPQHMSDVNYGLTLYLMEIQVTKLNSGNSIEFPKDTDDSDEELPF